MVSAGAIRHAARNDGPWPPGPPGRRFPAICIRRSPSIPLRPRTGPCTLVSIRVALADDHGTYRRALARLLSQEPGLSVMLECPSGSALLQALVAPPGAKQPALPDVVLLDNSMPPPDGLSTARLLLQAHPELHLLMLSAHDDPAFSRAALAAGCLGHCSKHADWPLILHALREVAAGRRCVVSPDGPDQP